MEKELTRETVDPRYTWDLTRIYASDEAWEEAFADVKAQAEAFAKRAGTLSHGRETVLDALTAMMRMDETFFALHAYAMMKNNEDSTNAKYQAMSDRAGTLAGVVAAACSFMEPELLALEEGEIEKMIADPAFAEYDRYLSGVLRMKAHTLTASEEKLMAMASDACNASATAYEMLSYADMNLGKTRGENGEKVQLTDARLLSLLSSKDRAVRKAAYTNIMNGYNKFGNTIAATYAGQVKADIRRVFPHGLGEAVLPQHRDHGHLLPQQAQVVGDVPPHAAQRRGHPAGVGVPRHQRRGGHRADVHIHAAHHHDVGRLPQQVAPPGDVSLFHQVGDVHRHGGPGDPRLVCQLLLGDQGVLFDPVQKLPLPLGHGYPSFVSKNLDF